MKIPNEYSACEVYRGFTVGLKAGVYVAFDVNGRRSLTIPPADTRAGIRRLIDYEAGR